jgi:excisionase family DNA binding protein
MSAALETVEPSAMDARQAALGVEQLRTGNLDVAQLPEIAVRMISQVLDTLADGRGIAVMPLDSDLTPNQAADYLNVSRPYFLGLLNKGKIPFHRVGSHKRVHLRSLMAYRRLQDEESEKALAELASQAQELNMGY